MVLHKTVSFQGKHGRINSIRSSLKVGDTSVNLTTGLFNTAGGVTYRTNHITTRFSRGQAIGFGIKGYNNTRYYNKDLKRVSQLVRFR
ncbi:MAG: hypothetical protein ACOCRO_09270 [Halanaerobiales bacterium]